MAPLLQSATTPSEGDHIVLDLSGMILIDSAGVEILARVSAWTRRKGGELVLHSARRT